LTKKKVIIIGSGFAGLSAACFLVKAGFDVTVLEKHTMPGGRARQLKADGFTFDMGPSWYWMPDVFERFFEQFGKKVSDYYELKRLDPSYRIYWPEGYDDIAANYTQLQNLFETIEPGSAKNLDKVMEEALYKYKVGINKLVFKPGLSFTEFLDTDLIKGVFKLDVFTSIATHFRKHFNSQKLQQLMEFPVLFLGALPKNTPALYSLMNYADIKLGTWYPQGGMYKIVEAMYSLAKELGVNFLFNQNVQKINVQNGVAQSVQGINVETNTNFVVDADIVLGAADYEFIDQQLLPKEYATYTSKYWNSRVMAPSCLLYYVGLNKKIKNLQHHSLFFDVDFEKHGEEIYTNPQWPTNPLFYVGAASVTDPSCAPENCENIFFLIPVATGLQGDDETLRENYFNAIVKRFEEHTGQSIADNIVYKKTYSIANFKEDYNAFKGNAYGLANTLLQTAILKPTCKSKKVSNLFYTGQLTVPGPGVPPSLISGEIVSKVIASTFKN
jgi:phytoene desaturase